MTRFAPIAIAGIALAAIGPPAWAWFVIAEAGVLRAAIREIFT